MSARTQLRTCFSLKLNPQNDNNASFNDPFTAYSTSEALAIPTEILLTASSKLVPGRSLDTIAPQLNPPQRKVIFETHPTLLNHPGRGKIIRVDQSNDVVQVEMRKAEA